MTGMPSRWRKSLHVGCVQVARGRAIIPANKRHLELEPTVVGASFIGCKRLLRQHIFCIAFACSRGNDWCKVGEQAATSS